MRIFLLCIFLFQTVAVFCQDKADEYGQPLIILREESNWLSYEAGYPTFVLYQSGKALFQKKIDGRIQYYKVDIPPEKIDQFIKKSGITDSLLKLPTYIQTIQTTDEITNTLFLHLDTLKNISVYGYLAIAGNKERANTPQAFLNVYDDLKYFDDSKAKAWLPDSIEVMVSIYANYNRSPQKPIPWPKEWMNLDDTSLVKKDKDLYIFNLDKKFLSGFFKLVNGISPGQAFEFNGEYMALSYRIKFPNLKTL